MNKIRTGIFLTVLLLIFIPGFSWFDDHCGDDFPVLISSDEAAFNLAKKMFAKTKDIRTLNYTMRKTERIAGKLIEQQSYIKFNKNPFKVYIKQQSLPKKGLEVLFVDGKNNNKALINPNGFPWINVSLDPYGSTMRDGQHHTIFESGFDYFISVLEHLFNKYGEQTVSMLSSRTGVKNAIPCHILSFENPNFKYVQHKVKTGENLVTISDRYKVGEHMILERNKQVNSYYDVKPGQIIEVPNDYSRKLTLYIDKKKLLPVAIEVFDERGLYEQYEFLQVKVNIEIKPEEFTKEYHKYGF